MTARSCSSCNTPVPNDAAFCPNCGAATPTDLNIEFGEGFQERLSAALADRYRIDKELGRGGMAVVFLAHDLKHDRSVALKVMRPELAASIGTERFLREIQIAAKLSHPHILGVHDSGDAEGFLYYVMPFVEGESLRDRMNREGPLPIEEAVRIAREVAAALSYAHSLDIVHRDIKPENILLHHREAVVADFGIARAVTAAGGDRLTETGMAIGTPIYMSPEQASGDLQLDGRSDIYSLGCVLYEMLAGEPPYAGPTAQAIVAKKLSEAVPRVSVVRERVPRNVEVALDRALARERADRYAKATEFAEALGDSRIGVAPSATRPVVAERKRRATLTWLAGAALVVAVVAAIALFATRGTVRQPLPRPDLRKLTDDGRVRHNALSSDGRYLAYSIVRASADPDAILGLYGVMVKDLAGGVDRSVVDHLRNVWSLRWSPDGTRIGISNDGRGSDGQGKWQYLAVPPLGGTLEHLPVESRNSSMFAWSPDGTRVVSWTQGAREPIVVHDLPAGTVDSVFVPTTDEFTQGVDWSPRGPLLAVITSSGSGAGPSHLWVLNLDEGTHELVYTDSMALSTPRWAPGGDAIYYLTNDHELHRILVDPGDGRAEGSATLVASLANAYFRASYGGSYSVSADGRLLAYVQEHTRVSLSIAEAAEDGSTEVVTLVTGTAYKVCETLSPDGTAVAFMQRSTGGMDLYRVPARGGTAQPITVDGSVNGCVAWGPDGRQLAFVKRVSGASKVAIVDAAGGTPRPLEDSESGYGLAWAPSSLIAHQVPGNVALRIVDPETGDERQLPRLAEGSVMLDPHFSPEGTRLAVKVRHGSDFALFGLWVFSLEDDSWTQLVRGEGGDVTPLSWSADGRSVYARRGSVVLRVPVDGGEPVVVPQPDVDGAQCAPHERPRGLVWLCMTNQTDRDVWLVENFDPEYAVRSR